MVSEEGPQLVIVEHSGLGAHQQDSDERCEEIFKSCQLSEQLRKAVHDAPLYTYLPAECDPKHMSAVAFS